MNPALPERHAVITVLALRVGIVALAALVWEGLSRSGLFYRDVIPQLSAIAAALARLAVDPQLYWHLVVTARETAAALVIGSLAGLAAGLALGINRFLGKAFEPHLYYLGPTPKIIFFPIMIMWFGVGGGSKIAMGAISCFFPVALSVAAGVRGIDPILVRVAKSFRAGPFQMIAKIYLPAMREPVANGLRLGLGVAIIGVLLAETKLSNQGLGFLIIQYYQRFDMPAMYALIAVVFAAAILINTAAERLLARTAAPRPQRTT
jgi:ABC-type nitrate/sulfonate/bicarbonate transport system permease component